MPRKPEKAKIYPISVTPTGCPSHMYRRSANKAKPEMKVENEKEKSSHCISKRAISRSRKYFRYSPQESSDNRFPPGPGLSNSSCVCSWTGSRRGSRKNVQRIVVNESAEAAKIGA